MNHAGSLLTTYAREATNRLRREDYALPRERHGRLAVLGYCGDHLQFPPVPNNKSLFAPLENTSQEHRVGTSIFQNVKYVFQMQQMMRFKDPVLIRILHAMRIVGGQPLSNSDWQALSNTQTDDRTDNAKKPDLIGWYHTCYVWSIVTMASFMEARESASKAKKTLFYIQAVDGLTNTLAPKDTIFQNLFRAFLKVPSLTKTKRLPAFCLQHVGIEVRLTTTLDTPWAVQDATGTVLELQYADVGKLAMLESLQPEILLDELPTAVLVKLHDCKHVFLPVQPCSNCTIFTETCLGCMATRQELEGVVAVTPLSRTWKYDGSELNGQFINVKRRQMPLAPARVLPLYSMQGMTATPGLVAHWVVPPRLSSDIKWLICYVTLSRVPSLKQLRSIGLTEQIRDILEGGPPEGVVQMFSTLFDRKRVGTHAAALRARQRLGW